MFAKYTGRPEKFCSMHFGNEIGRYNTAEIMGHPETAPETMEQAAVMLKEKIEKGEAGVSAGKGFFDYKD